MTAVILGMLAETFVHPGSGQTTGAIDLPVARERPTNYPYIAGSSMKGALRDAARKEEGAKGEESSLFGDPDRAGGLLVSDARLLLLPVRSLSGSYKWVTCPYLLERLQRDGRRIGQEIAARIPEVAEGQVLTKDQNEGPLFLEERSFSRRPNQAESEIDAWSQAIAPLMASPAAAERLPSRLAVLCDDDFAWFASYGLPVQARNVLHEETKESKNLWYEETLPPDTLLYCVLAARNGGALAPEAALGLLFGEAAYLQLGGNETVGQGWFALAWNRA